MFASLCLPALLASVNVGRTLVEKGSYILRPVWAWWWWYPPQRSPQPFLGGRMLVSLSRKWSKQSQQGCLQAPVLENPLAKYKEKRKPSKITTIQSDFSTRYRIETTVNNDHGHCSDGQATGQCGQMPEYLISWSGRSVTLMSMTGRRWNIQSKSEWFCCYSRYNRKIKNIFRNYFA